MMHSLRDIVTKWIEETRSGINIELETRRLYLRFFTKLWKRVDFKCLSTEPKVVTFHAACLLVR